MKELASNARSTFSAGDFHSDRRRAAVGFFLLLLVLLKCCLKLFVGKSFPA